MAFEDYYNEIVRNSGFAARDRAIADSFYGLNITGRNAALPANTENHGFTFFTRPLLNMSYDNLVIDRVLANLLSEVPNSYQRLVRGILDPRHTSSDYSNFECPGIDNLNPFISILSNNLVSLSGWPDFTLNTHSTPPGIYREEYSYVDDVPYNYGGFDLQATFRNITGDPITLLALCWGWYMGLVFEGRIMPYPDLVLLNELDYHTRIYRLIMDKSRTYVTRIGATGSAYPTTAPIGNIFNFEGDGSETPFQTVNDQLSFNFRCMGFTHTDPILVYEFNTTVELTNPSMRDESRESVMTKIQQFERSFFNANAYPRINELTNELEWWVFNTIYNAEKAGVIRG